MAIGGALVVRHTTQPGRSRTSSEQARTAVNFGPSGAALNYSRSYTGTDPFVCRTAAITRAIATESPAMTNMHA